MKTPVYRSRAEQTQAPDPRQAAAIETGYELLAADGWQIGVGHYIIGHGCVVALAYGGKLLRQRNTDPMPHATSVAHVLHLDACIRLSAAGKYEPFLFI